MARYSIISVAKINGSEKLHIICDAYIKSIAARVYLVDEGYDFGAIDPKDLAAELYLSGESFYPGIQLKVN